MFNSIPTPLEMHHLEEHTCLGMTSKVQRPVPNSGVRAPHLGCRWRGDDWQAFGQTLQGRFVGMVINALQVIEP